MTIGAPRDVCFALWISCLILLISGTSGTAVSAQSYLYTWCSGRGQYSADSKFGDNLNRLLYRRLFDQGPVSGFFNTTEGEDPDKVYGLFLCRGDVAADLCQACIDSATSNILERCPREKEAIIWYDECLVHYSNRSFFSTMESLPAFLMINHIMVNRTDNLVPSDPIVTETFKNVTEFATRVSDVVRNVSSLAISSKSLYATTNINVSRSVTLHELAQCTPDISKSDCSSCLFSAIVELSNILSFGRGGARILLPSCNVRYELYGFYGEPRQAPAPSATSKTSTKGKRVERNAIIGSIIGVIIIVASCILFIYFKHIFKKDEENSQEDQLLHPILIQMPLDIIREATANFSEDCKLGEGGFGPVYKGTLADGKEIAVKRRSRTSRQGRREFENEVNVTSKLQHRNLVQLLGWCTEEDEEILIYEYLPNKSLDVFLFDMGQSLDWNMRMNIACGIARGLLYLHEDSRMRIIHRDLKASNILLVREMNPKISDFGMASTFHGNQDEANTNTFAGTPGYMAPEYVAVGHVSIKSDVFSFGILLLEIVSGRKSMISHLREQALNLESEGRESDLIDPIIKESCDEVTAVKCIRIGLLCTQDDPDDRPTMSVVVRMLGGDGIPDEPLQPTISVGRDLTTINPIGLIHNASTSNEVTL
ncbi:hypothetical protein BT93_L5890 [Corymbia citriodora subsp. variegata]|uniref:Cysteine-rich receptor-like protein kinase 25 n=1 Tax=Corymbia citriodora subsp. variegata TaxID=360336 RepID=A0A8T0CQZ0_CORYI|nr:hypothetical protein BT93_L5890 [Corymbia citriodora subsp. variegata]